MWAPTRARSAVAVEKPVFDAVTDMELTPLPPRKDAGVHKDILVAMPFFSQGPVGH